MAMIIQVFIHIKRFMHLASKNEALRGPVSTDLSSSHVFALSFFKQLMAFLMSCLYISERVSRNPRLDATALHYKI